MLEIYTPYWFWVFFSYKPQVGHFLMINVAYKGLLNTHFMFICQIPIDDINNCEARSDQGLDEVWLNSFVVGIFWTPISSTNSEDNGWGSRLCLLTFIWKTLVQSILKMKRPWIWWLSLIKGSITCACATIKVSAFTYSLQDWIHLFSHSFIQIFVDCPLSVSQGTKS